MHLKYSSEHESENCRSIVYFLDRATSPQAETIVRDLCWRAKYVDPLNRAFVLAQTFHAFLPEHLRSLFPKDTLGLVDLPSTPQGKKEHKDLAIVTVIGPELKALLRILGKLPTAMADQKSGDYSYWFAKVARPNNTSLDIVLTVVAEQRNVPCALAVDHILADFDARLIMLIGIAGGVYGKVNLGDVVYALQVYDYEGCRLEMVKYLWFLHKLIKRPRPRFWNTSRRINVAMQQFDERQMRQILHESMRNVNPDELPSEWRDLEPKVHLGSVAAGEKLIADGSLKRMRWIVDDLIRAGTMEDSGFAQAAEHNKVEWCIFRGVSDFANPRKDDKWQATAALSASAAGITAAKMLL
jgi:nucleoside phosphorylase